MRFLVDECLSSSLAARLRDAEHDAIHVVGAGLAGQPDSVVKEAARVESRILVSADTDFGELLARSNASAPSLVLHRGSDVDPAVLSALLIGKLDMETLVRREMAAAELSVPLEVSVAVGDPDPAQRGRQAGHAVGAPGPGPDAVADDRGGLVRGLAGAGLGEVHGTLLIVVRGAGLGHLPGNAS